MFNQTFSDLNVKNNLVELVKNYLKRTNSVIFVKNTEKKCFNSQVRIKNVC